MYFWYLIIFLGLLNGFGPFVIDMYLPALPEMSVVFHTSSATIQLGLTFCLIGLAAGQLITGPISDKYGRKWPLTFSLVLYIAATIGCCYSTSIAFFNFLRFLQGLGAAGGIVISRSVATDLYSGKSLTKIIGMISAVNGLAPIIAPVLGGFIAGWWGWRGVFFALLILGVVLLFADIPFKESLQKSNRIEGDIVQLLKNYFTVIKIPGFSLYTLVFSLTMATLFSYIAAAPFIIQKIYHFSEVHFSVIFALNAVSVAIGSILSIRLKSAQRCTFIGVWIGVVGAFAGLVLALTTDSFLGYLLPLILMLFGLGFLFTGSTTKAMAIGRHYAGVASAILGCLGFIFGGIASPLTTLGDLRIVSSALCFFFMMSALVLCWTIDRKRY